MQLKEELKEEFIVGLYNVRRPRNWIDAKNYSKKEVGFMNVMDKTFLKSALIGCINR